MISFHVYGIPQGRQSATLVNAPMIHIKILKAFGYFEKIKENTIKYAVLTIHITNKNLVLVSVTFLNGTLH